MWLLLVIVSGSYINDLHFQEFTTKQNCEVIAAKIRKHISEAIVSCDPK